MLSKRPAAERGTTHNDWLHSRHSFSFGSYYDPQAVGFSDLLVINDDIVQPGQGFATHAHRDMEIFSYVLDGALEHRDSLEHGSVIYPGDVQLMSAGSGIRHSEFNHSREALVHFLQIWIVPARQGVAPRYQQLHVDDARKRGRLCCLLAPEGEAAVFPVCQELRLYAGLFDGDESATLALPGGRYGYVHVARGSISVNGLPCVAGDGVRLTDEPRVELNNGCNAEVLLFDLRPNLLPEG